MCVCAYVRACVRACVCVCVCVCVCRGSLLSIKSGTSVIFAENPFVESDFSVNTALSQMRPLVEITSNDNSSNEHLSKFVRKFVEI